MDYETIDWEAEAQHLKTAFGVVGKCLWASELNFYHYPNPTSNYGKILVVKSTEFGPLMCSSGDRVRVIYNSNGLHFELSRLMDVYCSAHIFWNSSAQKILVEAQTYAPPMKRAIFHLVRFSPAVAAAMNLTEHEKLEYEQRYGL